MTEIEKKRELVREIIEKALRGAISGGLMAYGKRQGKWWKDQSEWNDCTTDILFSWQEDEDGEIAVERLVSLIIY